MPSPSLHEQYIAAYVLHIIIRAIFQPPQTLEDLAQELNVDISSISISKTAFFGYRCHSLPACAHICAAWADS